MIDPREPARAQKAALRRACLDLRRTVSAAERKTAEEAVTARLLEINTVRAAALVMGYLPWAGEISPLPLMNALHACGASLAVPHMAPGRTVLVAARFTPGEPLEPGPYRVLQPVDFRSLSPAEIAVVLVPGVAFDRRGMRLGYGKGYYDRLLADSDLKAFTIGLAYEFQLVDEVPHEPHDVPVDAVATPLEWHFVHT